MIPRTFPSTYASNGQQQMVVHFLTSVAGLARWSDYIPVKLVQGGPENSYSGTVDVAVIPSLTAATQAWKEYIPVYADDSATDAWTVNNIGYIPYNYALFNDASMQLDLTNGAALDSRVTFTRATTATRTNSSGLIESVAINAPRFDYNPTTLASLGLLIEEQRVNLILQSETCDVSPWVTAAPYSVSANAAISPDGTQNADAVIVASGQSAFNTNVTRQIVTKAASAIQYTRSTYFKALGVTTSVRFVDFGSITTNSASVIVSLVNGSVVTAAATAGTFSGASVAVTNAGNGWWRVALTYTTDTATSLTVRSFPYVGNVALTGDGTSGLLVYGAQLEAGAFATSYIPTVASQVTRSADVAVMTGTNFSSWYSQGQGTLYIENEGQLSTTTAWSASITDAANTEIATIRNFSNTARFGVQGVASGSAGATVAGVPYKTAFAFSSDNQGMSVNGATTLSGTTAMTSEASLLRLASNPSGNNVFTTRIRKVAYYPLRVTDAQLQALTS